jgi:hypothetical protein
MSDSRNRIDLPSLTERKTGRRLPDPWSRTHAGEIASHSATSRTVSNRPFGFSSDLSPPTMGVSIACVGCIPFSWMRAIPYMRTPSSFTLATSYQRGHQALYGCCMDVGIGAFRSSLRLSWNELYYARFGSNVCVPAEGTYPVCGIPTRSCSACMPSSQAACFGDRPRRIVSSVRRSRWILSSNINAS